MIDEIEPFDSFEYIGILEEIEFEIFCWSQTENTTIKIKNRVYFSENRKFARITLLVNYYEFVQATKETKAYLVVDAIKYGLNMLKDRVYKKTKVDINDAVCNMYKKLDEFVDEFLTRWDFVNKKRLRGEFIEKKQ